MPKVTDDKEAHLHRIIRDAMAIDPLISLRSLQSIIEKKINRKIEIHYISKLVKKVNGQLTIVADREKVEIRVSQLRERNRILIDELFRIAYPTTRPVADKDRLKAIELIAKIEHNQAKLEMDFGLFTRHLGDLNVNHNLKPIDDITRANQIKAFEAWGMNPPEMRKVDMRIIDVKSKDDTSESKTDPTPPSASATPSPVGSERIPGIVNAGLVATE